MNDILISMTLVIVLGLVIVAILVRNHHVKDFNLNSRARKFAEYVAETMVKRPDLRSNHGFYITPDLAERVVIAFRHHFPRAKLTKSETNLVLVYDQNTWTIPVCTAEEYTEHYI